MDFFNFFFPTHTAKKPKTNNERTQETYSRLFLCSRSSLLSNLLYPLSILASSSIQLPDSAPRPPLPSSFICAVVQGLEDMQLLRGNCCLHWNMAPHFTLIHFSTYENYTSSSGAFYLKPFLGKERSTVTVSPFKLKARCGSSHQCCSG